jgi:hypothetical protein
MEIQTFSYLIGDKMPEFATVPLKEAQLRTAAGRGGRIITEYVDYIQSLSQGQAGRLRVGEQENPLTIRRRLVTAAKALEVPLIVKRSGNDLYFWQEAIEEEQPRTKRRYTRRNKRQEETPEQYFSETGELDHEVPEEESPELGQRAQEAERRVEQS